MKIKKQSSTLLTKHKLHLCHILTFILLCAVESAYAGSIKDIVPNRHYYDSIFAKRTGDTIPVSFPRMISLHTNIIDWVTTTPNVTVEFDLSPFKRTCYSILITGKFNPNIDVNTTHLRWVYNVIGVKGEFRKYWRTGNVEEASIPTVIEPDTTLWKPFSKISYFRRRYLSGRYVKKPRYWRAYYIGLYAAYDKFSICLDGSGKQGDAISFGLSAGYSVPLYKHLDGSGWDLDLGISIGAMITSYTKYEYYRESGCYVFAGDKPRHIVPFPVPHDIHISLAYRFRTIDRKALYGATRFMLNEERRALRENYRVMKIEEERARKDSILRYSDIRTVLTDADAQLAKYPDSTAYYYLILKGAVDYTEKNIEDLKTDDEWQFKRDVLGRNLEYYMNRANELAPEHLRYVRPVREKKLTKEQKAQKKQAAKEAEKAAKEKAKADKLAAKEAKQAEKQAAKEAKHADKETEQTDKPVEQAKKPAEQTDKPVEQAEKPAEQAEKPAEPAEKQAESEKKEEVKE